jgi:hypothetical protein
MPTRMEKAISTMLMNQTEIRSKEKRTPEAAPAVSMKGVIGNVVRKSRYLVQPLFRVFIFFRPPQEKELETAYCVSLLFSKGIEGT